MERIQKNDKRYKRMKHLHTFENFLNEARAVQVDLTPEMFSTESTWGIYKDMRSTGNSTWRWNSNLLADANPEGNIPGEQNVIMLEAQVMSSGKIYVKVGITNHLKKEPTTTYGKIFSTTVEDFEKAPRGISKGASDFLMDNDHFRFINQNIKSNRQSLKVVPKGDFGNVLEQLIEAAIKNK